MGVRGIDYGAATPPTPPRGAVEKPRRATMAHAVSLRARASTLGALGRGKPHTGSRGSARASVRARAKPWSERDCRLVLEDGSVWRGRSFGAKKTTVGEVVFNTSLSGCVEA